MKSSPEDLARWVRDPEWDLDLVLVWDPDPVWDLEVLVPEWDPDLVLAWRLDLVPTRS